MSEKYNMVAYTFVFYKPDISCLIFLVDISLFYISLILQLCYSQGIISDLYFRGGVGSLGTPRRIHEKLVEIRITQ